MSYCRFSEDSDVYCFYSAGGYYEIWSAEGLRHINTTKETIALLRNLQAAGEKVPDYAFEELEKELSEDEEDE